MQGLKRMDGKFTGNFPAVYNPVFQRCFSGNCLVRGDITARFGGLYMNSLLRPIQKLKGQRRY